MKGDRYLETGVICPFYRWSTKSSIGCSGITPLSGIVNTFPNGREKREYQNQFCRCGKWEKCRLAVIDREDAEKGTV